MRARSAGLHRRIPAAALAVVGALLCASTVDAQTAHDRPAAIVVAHGAEAEWNDRVRDIAGIAETGGPVEVAFLMGREAEALPFQDVVAGLVEGGASEIVIVPLLVSSHSGHYDQLRWLAGEIDSLSGYMAHHLEMAGITRPSDPSRVRLAAALDDAPELADVLADRALALAESPAEQALFLIGHGPNSAEDYAAWMTNLRPVAERVESVAGFRDVKLGLVRDDAPPEVRAEAVRGIRETIALQRELTGRPVVVVPILVSEGRVSREKIPADLEGLDVVYSGEPILPHPALARWIARRVNDPGRGLVLCLRSGLSTETADAPRERGATKRNGSVIAMSRNEAHGDAADVECQATSETQH